MANNKYVKNIRKIVDIDPNQYKLQSAARKAAILGRRGIGYVAADGQVSISGSASTDAPFSGYTYSGKWRDSLFDRLAELYGMETQLGNSPDPNDPLKSISDTEKGTYSVSTVIDDPTGIIVPKSNQTTGMGNNPVRSGTTVNGLTGMIDPDTGKEFRVRFNGLDYPPTGWFSDTDIVEPGQLTYSGFTQGYQWIGNAGGTNFTAITPIEAIYQAFEGTAGVPAGYTISAADFNSEKIFEHLPTSIDNTRFYVFARDTDDELTAFKIAAQPSTCTPDADDPLCPLTAKAIQHPIDDVITLIRSNGKLQPSLHEPPEDIITKFMDNQHSRVDFEFGLRTGAILPAHNGGWILTETDAIGGNPTGVAKLFGSDNKFEAFLPSTLVSSYVPHS